MTRSGIKSRLTAGFYISLFSLLACVGTWIGFDLASSRRATIAERTNAAILESQYMSQWFRTALLSSDYVLRDVNSSIEPEMAADASPEQIRLLSSWLGEKAATVPGLTGIAVYDENCVFRAASESAVIGFRSHQKNCLEHRSPVKGRASFQYMPAESSASRQPAILVSRNLFSPAGRFLGGTTAALDLRFTQHWIDEFSTEEGRGIAVLDERAILLARNPAMPEAIGKKVDLSAGYVNLKEASIQKGFVAISPLNGRELIYGVSKAEDVPFTVVVGYDLKMALAEWRRRAYELTAAFGVMALLLVLLLLAHRRALQQREEMSRLAVTDPLSGLANRRRLFEAGERECERMARYGGELAALIVDIDRFKGINDSWGHQTGDRAIQAVARILEGVVRKQDMVGRLGGEEFLALMPETGEAGAAATAERIRAAIEAASLPVEGGAASFTASVGYAVATAGESFDRLLGRADRGLYAAKESGRNRCLPGPEAA